MFEWSEKYATKIFAIDTQHQQVLMTINELALCCKNDNPSEDVIDRALQEINSYGRKHFAAEEGLMIYAKVDMRHIRLHRMEHQSFIYDASNLSFHSTSPADLMETTETLARFLTAWWTYHILGVDHAMAAQIFAIKQGATPEQAYESWKTIKHDAATTHLILESVLDLWRNATKRCHVLEEKLAAKVVLPRPYSR